WSKVSNNLKKRHYEVVGSHFVDENNAMVHQRNRDVSPSTAEGIFSGERFQLQYDDVEPVSCDSHDPESFNTMITGRKACIPPIFNELL
ncbi:hypothetical protein L9F63_027330, partial [Diploptera punctata]